MNRQVLLGQLGLLGLAVDTAADGIEALSLWQPGRYAAVLADMHMPRMDGYALTAEIRAREAAAGAAANADRRGHRERHARRGRALPGWRHGRLPRQAGDDRAA